MRFLVIIHLLVLGVSAHTQVSYPIWRANALNPPYDERVYPCAGIVDDANTPRTPWPLDGGSLNFTLHDGAALVWVSLGLGANVTNFNITLPGFPFNETGAGNVCFPKLTLPSGLPISEGTQGSIQITTSNPKNGGGLYVCSDIVFTGNATLLATDQCANSSTVSLNPLFASATPTNATASTAKASGASAVGPSLLALVSSCLFAVMLL